VLCCVGDRQQLFKVLSGQQQLPHSAFTSSSSSSSSDDSAADAAAAAARKAWEEASSKLQSSWSTTAAAGGSSSSDDAWVSQPISYEEAEQTWQQLLHLAGQRDGPRFDQVLLASSDSDGVQRQLQQLQRALQRSAGIGDEVLQELSGFDSSNSGAAVRPKALQQLQQVFAAPPSLEQLLQQRWQQVG